MSDVEELVLSYTFFKTGKLEPTAGTSDFKFGEEDEDDEDKNGPGKLEVDQWTKDMARELGIQNVQGENEEKAKEAQDR